MKWAAKSHLLSKMFQYVKKNNIFGTKWNKITGEQHTFKQRVHTDGLCGFLFQYSRVKLTSL